MNDNSRMLIYISIMSLISGCVLLVYGLLFFGLDIGSGFGRVNISPSIIVVAGTVVAAVMGIASGILSDHLSKKIDNLSPRLRIGLPLIIVFIALLTSIGIALMSR